MKKYLLVLLIFVAFFSCDKQIISPSESEGGTVNVTNYLSCPIEIILDGMYKNDLSSNSDSSYHVIDDGKHFLKIRTISAGWEDLMNFEMAGGDTVKFIVTTSGIIQIKT